MTASISLMQRPATAGSFKKGQSGNPSGKRRGTLNGVTIEAREAAALIVDDPAYRAALTARVIAGTAPQMEPLLWAYAKGRPVERIEQGAPGAFADLTDADLKSRMIDALRKL